MFAVTYFIGIFILTINLCLCYGQRNIQNVREHCKFRRNRKLTCNVAPNKLLDFRDIRLWTERYRSRAIEVYCEKGGQIFLPWPAKAENLRKFLVKGCLIKGYFSEYKETYPTPDSLTDLGILDCTVETNIFQSLNLISKIGQFSQSYDCGQLTVENLVIRNMTYFFITQPGDVDFIKATGVMQNAADRLLEETKKITYRCVYSKLRYLDSSVSNSRSKFHLKLTTDHSDYPELRFYNFSDNLLPKVPVQFADWSVYFPKLEYLDISNNRLKTFNFFPYSQRQPRNRPLYVDMRWNTIQNVPSTILPMIRAKVPVLVDVRNNPLHCDCKIRHFREYLELISIRYPKYNFLLDTKCSSPPRLAGMDVVSLTDDVLNC